MVRFAGGAQGVIETSRVACGRKMGLSYVITGTKGTISFTQERMAELKLYLHDDPVNRRGFALYWLARRTRTTARFAWEPGMVSALTTRKQ